MERALAAGANEKPAGHTESLIAGGTVIAGDILFSGGLRIDGEVRGSIRGEMGTLVVGETGRVEGDVYVARLIVSGTVAGSVIARDVVRLLAKARVECELTYGTAEIHPGAVIEGRLVQRPVRDAEACPLALAAATA